MSCTRILISVCARSLSNLSMAPHFRMLSVSKLTNCLGDFNPCASQTSDSVPTKIWAHGAIIYSRDISIDIVRSDGFLVMAHIECRIWRTIVLFKMDSIGQAAHLRRDLEGLLDQIDGGPAKEASECFPIMLSGFDSACSGLCLMLIEIHLVNITNATFIKYCINTMLLDYNSLSLAVVPKLVKEFSVWVLSVIHQGIVPLFAAFIKLMVEDGGIPVRIACPDNVW